MVSRELLFALDNYFVQLRQISLVLILCVVVCHRWYKSVAACWYNAVISYCLQIQREAFTIWIVFVHGVHCAYTARMPLYISQCIALQCSYHCRFEFSKLPTEGANWTRYLMECFQWWHHEKCPSKIGQRDGDPVKLKWDSSEIYVMQFYCFEDCNSNAFAYWSSYEAIWIPWSAFTSSYLHEEVGVHHGILWCTIYEREP